MATTAKNFRIKQGLVVEGTTGTINGNNILTESTAGDNYILSLVGGATLVKSVDTLVFNVDGNGKLTINSNTFDAYGAAGTAESNAKSYADSLATNYDAAGAAGTAESNAKSYADSLAPNYDGAGAATTAYNNAKSYADGLASNYDAAGAAGTAETNAKSYADSLATNYDPAGTAAGLAGNYDAAGAASTAESNAKSYADSLATNYDASGSASTAYTNALADANTYTDGKVSDLVGMAPSLLDTLEKIDAAIANDANFSTTLLNDIATAQSTAEGYTDDAISAEVTRANAAYDAAGAATTAKNDAKSYADSLASNYDAAGAAGTAETNAKSYADGLAVNYDAAGSASTAQSNAEGYTDTAIGNVLDGNTKFTALNINDVSGTYAAVSTVATAGTATAWSFDSSVFTSAKLLVKFKTGTHTQVSEMLLTLDSSGNVATTEYAEVGTNGSLGSVTAVNTSGIVSVVVTTAYNTTDVMVYATTLI